MAVLVVLVWLASANPERGLGYAWVVGTGSLFLVTGLAQLWLYARATAPPAAPYGFILVDSLLLATVLLAPNPFATTTVPAAMPLRFAGFLYFFVLLMQMAFSFRPRLLLWSTLCERENADVALLQGLKPRGPHTVRGRDAPIDLWTA